MALANTIVGDGILISVDVDARVWRVYGYPSKVCVYKETQKVEVREWVALTKTIAQTTAEAADQSGLEAGAVATYAANEDSRTIASYKLTKTITYAPTVTLTKEDYPV